MTTSIEKNVVIKKINESLFIVQTAYNINFVKKARLLGGKWSYNSKGWVFSIDELEDVKKALRKTFGEDGDDEEVEYITLHVTNYNNEVTRKGISLFGRSIVYATDKRSGGKLGANIIWLEGEFGSGGSNTYWTTIINDGEFKIKNFNKNLVNKKVKDAIDEGWCRIV